MNLESLEEVKRQLKAVWINIDELREKATSAEILAKHADRGYIEIYSELKNIKKDFSNIDMSHKELLKIGKDTNNTITKLKIDLYGKLNKNLKWTLMFILSLLTGYGAILFSVLK